MKLSPSGGTIELFLGCSGEGKGFQSVHGEGEEPQSIIRFSSLISMPAPNLK